jgi:hypothetical protein
VECCHNSALKTPYDNNPKIIARKHHVEELVNFEFEKETKNSIRYKEVPAEGKAPIVGSLYIQKWFAGGAKTLRLSIELNA